MIADNAQKAERNDSAQELARLSTLIQGGPLETPPMNLSVAALREFLGASLVGLTLQQPNVARPLLLFAQSADFDTNSFMERYLTHFSTSDPFPYAELEPEKIYTLAGLLGINWHRSGYYQDFLKPFGIDHGIVIRLQVAHSLVAYLFAARREPAPTFGDDDLKLITSLIPQLSQALHISSHIRRLEVQRNVYEEAVGAVGIGTILLDWRRSVISTNLTARIILSEQKLLMLQDDKICARSSRQHVELGEAVDRALSDATGCFFRAMTIADEGSEIFILVRALNYPVSTFDEPAPRVAIFFTDRTKHPKVPQQIVKDLFNLSTSEASLAVKLSEGFSLVEAAQLLHLSENTARSYCKSIFSKTGTTRQAEVVQLILAGVARVGAHLGSDDQRSAI